MLEPTSDRIPGSIFRRDGDRFHPTSFAQGPWHDGSQHGGPMMGLLARAVELHPADKPMQVTRFTVDMMRAAPMAPVSTRVRTLRAGRSVELLEAWLLCGGEECARASAMRFRLHELAIPESFTRGAARPELPPAADFTFFGESSREQAGADAFWKSVEMRPATGSETPTVWYRMRVPLVEGEEITPLQRVAAVSDFTYTAPMVRHVEAQGSLATLAPIVSINPDTTLNLHRPLEGDWVCLDVRVVYDTRGAGSASARLFDQRGAIGYSSQSILLRGPGR